MIHDAIRGALHDYMGAVLEALNCGPELINSVEDHVHILFELSRTVAISKVVEEVKKRSSKWLKTQGPQFTSFAWQGGYAVFAISESDVSKVRNYVARQQEHHRKEDFQRELRALLDVNGVAFDERYVWD